MSCPRARSLDRWQTALRQVLTAYVNGSYLRRSAKWAHPLMHSLTVVSVHGALEKIAHATCALNAEYKKKEVRILQDELDQATVRCRQAPEDTLVSILTEGYKLLRELTSAEKHRWPCEELPLSREFDVQEYQATDASYFDPVIRLTRFIRRHLAAYLDIAVVHGSVADLGLSRGYSDLDTFLILSETTVTHPATLRRFAHLCYHSLGEVFRFDALQHHGHMIATSIDMEYYPECWLPLSAFPDSKLIHKSHDVRVHVRSCLPDARVVFDQSVDDFHRGALARRVPPKPYDFKYLQSNLMLLPARYLQAKGVFCSKKHSFALARSYLPSGEWSIVDRATICRRDWPYTRNHWMDSLTRVAAHLSPHLVKTIRRAASVSSIREYVERHAGGVSESASRLAADMHADLCSREAGAISARTSLNEVPVRIVDHPLNRRVEAYDEARSRYVNQVSTVPAASAVYEYGCVSVPGLSDLDFVVTISEEAKRADPQALSIRNLSYCDRSLVLHEPIIVPDSLMRHLKQFMPFAAPRRLWSRDSGEGLQVREIDSLTALFVQAALLIEKLFSYRIWLVYTLSRGTVDARWSLAVLNSICYSVSASASVTGRPILKDNSEYVETVSKLRESWFGECSLYRRNAALRQLLSDAQRTVRHLIRSLVDFFSVSSWLTTAHPLPQEVVCPHPSTRLVFTDDWVQQEACLPKSTEQSDRLHLPPMFLRVLGLYSHSEHLAEAFAPGMRAIPAAFSSAPQTEFEKYLSFRSRLLGHQTRFLRRHRYWYGSFLPGGWIEL